MIDQYIQLGKITDSIFFKEIIDKEIIAIVIYLDYDDDEDKFYIEKVDTTKDYEDKDLMLYIQPTKLLTQGSTTHFLIHDFKLSSSMIDGKKGDLTILNDKIHRNYSRTYDYYKSLKIEENIQNFIDMFYSFVLEDEGQFIQKVFSKQSELKNKSQSELSGDYIFSYSISKSIIDKFNLKVREVKDYYYLSELRFFKRIYAKINADKNLKRIKKKGYECSFCGSKENDLYSPNKSGFYFSFTGGKENNFFNLKNSQPENHIVICDECYDNLKTGERFVKDHLQGRFMGVKYYTTYNIYNKKIDKKAIEVLKKEGELKDVFTSREMEEKLELVEEIKDELYFRGLIANSENITVNIFFGYEDNGFRLIKMINDIYPTRIIDLFQESNKYNLKIGYFLNELYQPLAKQSKSYDFFVKLRVDLLERILLERPINYDDLLTWVIKRLSYYIRNKDSKSKKGYQTENFTVNFLKFLFVLSNLNCEIYSNKINLKGFNKMSKQMKVDDSKNNKTGLQKLEHFVGNNDFIKNNPEIEAGMYLGILIARLSYNINNYEKSTIGYAEKRLNDIETLKRFINSIQNKIILHEMGNQKIYEAFSEKILPIFNKQKFSKNDFIFGMFLGYSLNRKFTKSKKNKGDEENE